MVPFFGAAFKMANPVDYVTKMRNKVPPHPLHQPSPGLLCMCALCSD